MTHLDYYSYQNQARGVLKAEDVVRLAREQAFLYQQCQAWLPVRREARIVDLGCGHGSLLVWLRELGYVNLEGVDSSAEQIAIGRSAGLSMSQHDALKWIESVESSSCDVLFAVDFIEHIQKDDFMRLLANSRRALKPDGRLILRYPNGDSPFVGLNLFNDITHIWTYTTNCLETLGRMHGFQSVKFADQGYAAIRDHRWIKVPLGRLSLGILKLLVQAATRERIRYWNSSIWACLRT